MPPVGGGGVSVRSIREADYIECSSYRLQHHPPPTAPVGGGGAGSAPGETSIQPAESFGAAPVAEAGGVSVRSIITGGWLHRRSARARWGLRWLERGRLY